MSSLDPSLVNMVAGFEGFTPRAKWDYKQNSVGYGTHAQFPGQTVTREQAQSMLADELSKHVASVDQAASQYGYQLGPSQRNALTSFSYNLGPGVMSRVLEQAGGDASKVPGLLTQYVNVTDPDGSKHALPGLISRRNAEATLFSGGPYAAMAGQTVAGDAPMSQANAPVATLPALMPHDTDISGLMIQGAKKAATPVQMPQAQRLVSQTPNQSVKLAANLPDLFIQ